MIRDLPSRRVLLGLLLGSLPEAVLAQSSLLDQGRSLLNQVPGAAGNAGSGGGLHGASLSQGEIGSGLKDGLQVAPQRVVGRVGKTDGFNGDSSIRIPLPGPLAKIEGPLKAVG